MFRKAGNWVFNSLPITTASAKSLLRIFTFVIPHHRENSSRSGEYSAESSDGKRGGRSSDLGIKCVLIFSKEVYESKGS